MARPTIPDFDLQNFLPYLLNQAAEASSLGFQTVYKERYGMLRTEWRVLFHLGLYGRLTATEIGARARMHKTKISRAVAKLEERRMLRRTPDAEDRRVEWLDLTMQGKAAYRDLYQVAERYESELMADMSEDEMRCLRTVLRRLAHMDDPLRIRNPE